MSSAGRSLTATRAGRKEGRGGWRREVWWWWWWPRLAVYRISDSSFLNLDLQRQTWLTLPHNSLLGNWPALPRFGFSASYIVVLHKTRILKIEMLKYWKLRSVALSPISLKTRSISEWVNKYGLILTWQALFTNLAAPLRALLFKTMKSIVVFQRFLALIVDTAKEARKGTEQYEVFAR